MVRPASIRIEPTRNTTIHRDRVTPRIHADIRVSPLRVGLCTETRVGQVLAVRPQVHDRPGNADLTCARMPHDDRRYPAFCGLFVVRLLNKRRYEMNSKIVGVILGVTGMLLWFAPLVYYGSRAWSDGIGAPYAGDKIGGIAYVLLLASIAYSALSWLEQHALRIVSSVPVFIICFILLSERSYTIAWGMIGLLIVHAIGLVLAIMDNMKSRAGPSA